jgi:transposase
VRLRGSKLSAEQTLRLCEQFVAYTPARTAADLVGVNKNTAALFYHRLREIVAARIEDECPLQGEIEIDESYFGGRRKGKRGPGAVGKVPVFGILKRGGRVYTKILPNTSRTALMPIIKTKIVADSVVYTDTYMTYDNLDVSGFRHHRINHRQGFAANANHINGIENFWRPSVTCTSTTASEGTTSISSQGMRVALQRRTSCQALRYTQLMDQAGQSITNF